MVSSLGTQEGGKSFAKFQALSTRQPHFCVAARWGGFSWVIALSGGSGTSRINDGACFPSK